MLTPPEHLVPSLVYHRVRVCQSLLFIFSLRITRVVPFCCRRLFIWLICLFVNKNQIIFSWQIQGLSFDLFMICVKADFSTMWMGWKLPWLLCTMLSWFKLIIIVLKRASNLTADYSVYLITAVLTGRKGMLTPSRHWYICIRGSLFAPLSNLYVL
jgi:hypothetical protein